MKSPVDRFEVNHRRESDSLRVMPSDDGMTVEMNVSARGMWIPVRLSKSQWRRLRKAMDKAFETVVDDGGHDTSFSDGFKVGYQVAKEADHESA